jgi:peptide/nickel transport system substrate-binding protein
MLGTGDVDFMDPNVSYYAVGYLGLRMWSRQLYTYPAIDGQTTTAVPDLATGEPVVTNGGTTYSVTIRSGVMWNTTPPRPVTGADFVLGVKRSCNPVQSFGGQPDFSALIAGYATFCTAFQKVPGTVAAIKQYIDSNQISGIQVSPSDPQTIIFTLTHPASYFQDMLSLPVFSPAPVEFLNYLPGSNDLAQHTISDGPYEVQSYDPAKSIVFVRNPVWSAATDPIRKAYVNQIDVTETGNQNENQQEILTNTPQADMEWDSYTPPNDVPQLLASKSPNFYMQTEYSSNPYIIFNAGSPNNNKALANVQVRQALSYALNRTHLIQDTGGPQVAPALTHVLPPGIVGASPDFDLYPNNPAKAKQMLAAAGFPNGLTLKFLYRPASDTSAKMFQTIQADLATIGVKVTGVGVPNADFYTKYLEVPTQAQQGVWDLSLAGWSPDWYGDAAISFFEPLFDGRVLPPVSSDFGLFNDPAVNAIIDKANAAPTESAAAALWHQADMQVMQDAAIYPITSPNQPEVHGTQVHNCVYMAVYEQCDPTNVWLSS